MNFRTKHDESNGTTEEQQSKYNPFPVGNSNLSEDYDDGTVDEDLIEILKETVEKDESFKIPIGKHGKPLTLKQLVSLYQKHKAKEGKNDESDENETFELCDFCKPRGSPHCFRCLKGETGRKIIKKGNVHGFGN